MHPRNIFKDRPPDFDVLAAEFPEFKAFVKVGLSGKSWVDFKEPAALKALTTVLLEKFFEIRVELPLNRLIPTVPLRLNYIHWIEDLIIETPSSEVKGLDVDAFCTEGNKSAFVYYSSTTVESANCCGPSCIYALLGHKINGWRFCATELDTESLKYAIDNVHNNSADQFITVMHGSEESIFSFLFKDNVTEAFTFTMCNPPFFADVASDDRSSRDKRLTISTASKCERSTDGGEVQFIKRMVNESMDIKDKVRWFTSMVGQKSSLKELLGFMREKQVPNYTTTEFRQGRTMRWGLAWTFSAQTAKLPKKPKKQKAAKPFCLNFPSSALQSSGVVSTSPTLALWSTTKRILDQLRSLEIKFNEPKACVVNEKEAFEVAGSAFVNTWTHQRRKKRQTGLKSTEVEGTFTAAEQAPAVDVCSALKVSEGAGALCQSPCHGDGNTERYCADLSPLSKIRRRCLSSENSQPACSTSGASIVGKHKIETVDPSKESEARPGALFDFSLVVALGSQFGVVDSHDMTMSLQCTDGSRELCQQLFVFFKNKLNGIQVFDSRSG